MRVRVFTDANLHRAAAGGWNLKALAEGKIGTLVKVAYGGLAREWESARPWLPVLADMCLWFGAGCQGGRTIEVEVPESATCKMLKKAIEDKEGIAMEGMSILTTSKQAIDQRSLPVKRYWQSSQVLCATDMSAIVTTLHGAERGRHMQAESARHHRRNKACRADSDHAARRAAEWQG
jgi:hypothetical protein